jgi:putative NIF3 family GTP cyclohydrolase 1 type 2
MDAKARGVSLIDIGHYESEKYFVDVLYEAIYGEIGLDIEILKINSQNPFKFL